MEPSPPRKAVLHHFLDAEPDEKAFRGGWACTDCGHEIEQEPDHDD